MKEYKKPAMLALSISANDQLCGGCQIGTRNNPEYMDIASVIGNGDDLLTEEEAKEAGMFGTAEGCANPYDKYCKFTSNGDLALFTS